MSASNKNHVELENLVYDYLKTKCKDAGKLFKKKVKINIKKQKEGVNLVGIYNEWQTLKHKNEHIGRVPKKSGVGLDDEKKSENGHFFSDPNSNTAVHGLKKDKQHQYQEVVRKKSETGSDCSSSSCSSDSFSSDYDDHTQTRAGLGATNAKPSGDERGVRSVPAPIAPLSHHPRITFIGSNSHLQLSRSGSAGQMLQKQAGNRDEHETSSESDDRSDVSVPTKMVQSVVDQAKLPVSAPVSHPLQQRSDLGKPRPPPSSSTSDSDSSSEDNLKIPPPVDSQILAVTAKSKPTATTDSSSSSSDSSESDADQKPAINIRKPDNPVASKVKNGQESSSDSSQCNSDSDIDDKSAEKIQKPVQAVANKKADIVLKAKEESSESSDESTSDSDGTDIKLGLVAAQKPVESKTNAALNLNGKRKPASSTSSSDSDSDGEKEGLVNKQKMSRMNTTFPVVKKKNEPYKRVKAEDVTVDHRMSDNSYEALQRRGKGATAGSWGHGTGGQRDWGLRANNVLKQVKGRNFRHEKTKKKRGSYRGGALDTDVKSIKFDDSD